MGMAQVRSRGILFITLVVILASSIVFGSMFLYFSGRGYVGIIRIRGYILTVQDRDLVVSMLDYVAKNDSIKAIVVEIDSGGGWVAPIEEIYYRLRALGEKKPTTASITGTAASGGYYMAIAAKKVFCLSSSDIGNVGVIGYMPPKEQVESILRDESIIVTGPYKVGGGSEKTFTWTVKGLLSGFLRAIADGRGERLKASEAELSKGLVYTGGEALELGLVDELGSTMDAVESAASMAGLTEYETVDILSAVSSSGSQLSYSISSPMLNLHELKELNQSPCLYYIFSGWVGSREYYEGLEPYDWEASYSPWPSSGEGEGKHVLFDASHLNAYSQDEMMPLVAEIVSSGHEVSYLEAREALGEELDGAEAFVVMSPGETYTEGEIASIKGFVDGGGKLLLVMDPMRAYARYINPLAAEFGMLFGNGYLYNLEENYGNFRNIIAVPRGENNVTEGVGRLVFYSATRVYTSLGIVFATNGTTWSESEEAGDFPIMCLLKDGRVLAIGDQTFFAEPYVEAEDDSRLVANIASFLTNSPG